MHQFHEGEEATIIKDGVEVEVVVFRQSGEAVYVFDKANRAYKFHVEDLLPAMKRCPSLYGIDGSLTWKSFGADEA